MIRKLLIIMAITLMGAAIGQAGGANQDSYECVSARGEAANGDTISLNANEYSDGYSYVTVYGYLNGNYFHCFGTYIEDPVNLNGSADHGTAEINTSEFICRNGQPPAMVSAECFANGRYSDQGVSNVKRTYGWDGIKYKTHENFISNSASCTIEADNVLYYHNNDDGFLRAVHYIDK